jgi:hypothetical protein
MNLDTASKLKICLSYSSKKILAALALKNYYKIIKQIKQNLKVKYNSVKLSEADFTSSLEKY